MRTWNRDDFTLPDELTPKVNTLGIGFQVPTEAYFLETTLINPSLKGDFSQQAGLWVGLNDDNFIKLTLEDKSDLVNTIQLRKEVSGVSGGSDAVGSADIPISALATLKLRLKIDPVAKTATAFYKNSFGYGANAGYAGYSRSLPEWLRWALPLKCCTVGSTQPTVWLPIR